MSASAALRWRLARWLRGRFPHYSARQQVVALEQHPDEVRAIQALNFMRHHHFDAFAVKVCDLLSRNDPLRTWATTRTYYAERDENAKLANHGAGTVGTLLLNDTDERLNIGCRLTSKTIKSILAEAYPSRPVTPVRLDFTSLTLERLGVDLSSPERLETALVEMSRRPFGSGVDGLIATADTVCLQPEGSLKQSTPLSAVQCFFAPLALAAIRGRNAVLINGTIPAYADARGQFVRDLLATGAISAASRDAVTARAYDIRFIPDSALTYEPDIPGLAAGDRDACLVTTGARNSPSKDQEIMAAALQVCRDLNLRPIVLTRSVVRFSKFRSQVAEMGGIFSETASLAYASELLSTCRLHVGGRYHMAILGLLCGVPSLLQANESHKNQWLVDDFEMVESLDDQGDLTQRAEGLSHKAGTPFTDGRRIRQETVDFLRAVTLTPAGTSQELKLALHHAFARKT